MGEQISLQDSHLISFGYVPRSGIAGSCGSSSFKFLRNFHTVSIYIPTNSTQRFSFLHIVSNTYLLSFWITAILTGMRWYFIVVLICLSLMISDAENLFMYLLAVCIYIYFLIISTFNYYLFIYLAVLGLRFCARAFSSWGKRGPLFIAVRGPLTVAASLVAEHRLQTRRLSSCGSRAQLLRGTWDLPRPGLEPVSPALAGRFSTTAPPGKPSIFFLI